MNTHVDKIQQNKSHSAANGSTQMQTGCDSTFQFIDNRPETVAQKNILEMANNSSHVRQLSIFQKIANNHTTQKQPPISTKANNTGLYTHQKKELPNNNGPIQFNNFSKSLPEADEDLSATEGLNRVTIPANMKRVAAVTGSSGKRYVTARGIVDAPPERLIKEAENLKALRDAGLNVPDIYKKKATPDENTTGVISEDVEEPFIIMDFVPGTFIDTWKAPGSLKPGIASYFAEVDDLEKAARAETVKAGIQNIINFLNTHIVVDLQIIIETGTGKVVIIDPAAIYSKTNEEGMNKHGDSYDLTLKALEGAKTQLESIIAPSEKPLGPPKTKEELEELYEQLGMDDNVFRARIRSMLQQAKLDDSDGEVEKYVKISECI